MKSFQEYITAVANENGMRTSLGPYPGAAGTSQYPPLYFAPIAADAGIKLQKYHHVKCTGKGFCQSDDIGPPEKKSKSKKKKKSED